MGSFLNAKDKPPSWSPPDGFLPDPNSHSNLITFTKSGLLLGLTRNLDKQRGFVNGALAEVVEPLTINAVFVGRLLGTVNYVLLHPIYEDGDCFLPCCYGFAITIRRTQVSDLIHGCLTWNRGVQLPVVMVMSVKVDSGHAVVLISLASSEPLFAFDPNYSMEFCEGA